MLRHTYLKILLLLCSYLLSANTSFALDHSAWPTIPLPHTLRIISTDENVIVNGLPMHMQAFVSSLPPAQLITSLQHTLGNPLVENHQGTQHILGRAEGPHGEYYLTVDVKSAGSGSRGTVAITDLKEAHNRQTQTQADTEYWISRLPAETQINNVTSSQDANIVSHYLVATNVHSEDLNCDYIKRLMHQDGLELSHESVTAHHAQPTSFLSGKTLYFSGHGKEAMATVMRNNSGQTTIVLNTTYTLDTLR